MRSPLPPRHSQCGSLTPLTGREVRTGGKKKKSHNKRDHICGGLSGKRGQMEVGVQAMRSEERRGMRNKSRDWMSAHHCRSETKYCLSLMAFASFGKYSGTSKVQHI